MALPEFVTPVVAVAGSPALAYVVARSLWHFVRAMVVMVASLVAIKTNDEDRRKACLALVDKVTPSSDQTAWPRRKAISQGDQRAEAKVSANGRIS
jgi:hypothetical protein